jgi:hypothetical protein
MRDLTEHLAQQYGLTEEERAERLPSGQQTIFSNRVAWAKSQLKNAGLLDNPSRGLVRISDLGLKVLNEAQVVLPGLLRVRGGQAADGDGLWRDRWRGNGSGRVWRRGDRRSNQTRQAGPGYRLRPG